jgi:hypothetical protein
MRRLSVTLGLASVFAVPAAALAASGASTDGSLVVKNGSATKGTPVVQLTITGSVIGQVETGKLVIDAGPNPDATAEPQVTGAGLPSHSPKSDTAQVWRSIPGTSGFKFRAIGGTYTVLVYGTGVNFVAVGTGSVKLAGVPDSTADGKYSLNGNDFVSLPGEQWTDKRTIGSNG